MPVVGVAVLITYSAARPSAAWRFEGPARGVADDGEPADEGGADQDGGGGGGGAPGVAQGVLAGEAAGDAEAAGQAAGAPDGGGGEQRGEDDGGRDEEGAAGHGVAEVLL
ncbi:BatC protein [Streptomyces sp. CS62]